ncbi:NAD-dependent epimerase/dehydratase [Capsaspora owczarzaki ATCC 30864]|uniref:NAD-dependent epimerase/dehydratase n=1 Tax=Capsaspora owczarzaki (strain ATCC 30864) TaxID=595528 RepID=UPI0001FE731B|nr:NAD-dependent epimerase/dehydratase [Capsaspora owczarzaki ATCC 30864]|eukprot:XP_004364061.1 NAD-dependent epimerase/dehydratase [Capsaspora owczarzaki ATCC 30864]
MAQQTVLVTGGSGFIASWCISVLLERGFKVRATVRSTAKEASVRAAVTPAAAVHVKDNLTCVVADLTADAGWDEAVAGCEYASDPEEVIRPAREGTLRVLRAATRAGVKRVVVTSSLAAVVPPNVDEDKIFDEQIWTDTSDPALSTYRRSKTLAERAAWEFFQNEPSTTTTLTTILPGMVLGPLLSPAHLEGSTKMIHRLLNGSPSLCPRISMMITDVRDLADAHVAALTSPDAAGQRLIITSEMKLLLDVATILREELTAEEAANVPVRNMPDWILRIMGWFSGEIAMIVPMIGRKACWSAANAQKRIGFTPRPARTTIVDCARSLLELPKST